MIHRVRLRAFAVLRTTAACAVPTVVLAAMSAFSAGAVVAQVVPYASSVYELSGSIVVDEADASLMVQLDQARRAMDAGQYDDALGILVRVADMGSDSLIDVTGDLPNVPRRYVSVRRYCQAMLLRFPPETIAEYRRLADPAFGTWFQQGRRNLDEDVLRRVVEQGLASSWADDALWLLGELRLREGDPIGARAYWEQLLPVDDRDAFPTWLSVYDSEYSPAEVRARIILADVLAGRRREAEKEAAAFAELHPDATGRFGGRDTMLVDAVRSLLKESEAWAAPRDRGEWSEFGGAATRQRQVGGRPDFSRLLWQLPLPSPPWSEITAWSPAPEAIPGSAETRLTPTSYFPIVVGDHVIVAGEKALYVVDKKTGKPAWGREPAILRLGDQAEVVPRLPRNTVGVPRYTVSSDGRRIFVPITILPNSDTETQRLQAAATSELICLDIQGQGRMLWRISPPENDLVFAGAPVCLGEQVAAVLWRDGAPARISVAAFDAATGKLQWERFVCSGDTPGRGLFPECVSLLIAADSANLYVNTNMGAVAALDRRRGTIRWITTYPRATKGDLANPEPWLYRAPNPCVVDRGTLYVAPADSPEVFAFEARTGRMTWHSGPETQRVRDLLGVIDDRLIASGDRLYWIELRGDRAGRIVARWPDGHEELGFGRGLLAESTVYWPTREAVYAVDAVTARPVDRYELLSKGAAGGNLVAADGVCLIAEPTRISAFSVLETHDNLRRNHQANRSNR
ncbi:outer membrane protein assembly factor BamB family protein [Thermostilla marina]